MFVTGQVHWIAGDWSPPDFEWLHLALAAKLERCVDQLATSALASTATSVDSARSGHRDDRARPERRFRLPTCRRPRFSVKARANH